LVAVGRAKSWMDGGPPEGGNGTRPGLGKYPMDFYEAGSLWALARKNPTF